jgi:hypothetical protein
MPVCVRHCSSFCFSSALIGSVRWLLARACFTASSSVRSWAKAQIGEISAAIAIPYSVHGLTGFLVFICEQMF